MFALEYNKIKIRHMVKIKCLLLDLECAAALEKAGSPLAEVLPARDDEQIVLEANIQLYPKRVDDELILQNGLFEIVIERKIREFSRMNQTHACALQNPPEAPCTFDGDKLVAE